MHTPVIFGDIHRSDSECKLANKRGCRIRYKNANSNAITIKIPERNSISGIALFPHKYRQERQIQFAALVTFALLYQLSF